MRTCHACKKELSVAKIGRRDVCEACGADLHCCWNCGLYDRSVSRQCREPVAEPVGEKDKCNFCDYFIFAEKPVSDARGAEDARRALNDLFKK
jgi:hypothetical protein